MRRPSKKTSLPSLNILNSRSERFEGRLLITLVPLAFSIASVIAVVLFTPLLLAAVLARYLTILLTIADYILRRDGKERASYAFFTLGAMYWVAIVSNAF